MFKRLLISLVVLSLWSIPAGAATLTGSSGLIFVPEADALAVGAIEASVHVSKRAIASVNLGLFPQVELGLHTSFRDGDLGYSLKGVLNPESANFPGVALGVESGDVYIALTRSVAKLRGTVGFGNGSFNGVFGGISYQLDPVYIGNMRTAPKLLFDYNGHLLNGGIRLSLLPKLELDVAFIDFDHGMIGVTYKAQF